MTTQPTEDDIAAIKDLIDRSTLVGIEYHDLAATLSGAQVSEEAEPTIDMQLQIEHRCGPDGFGFRLVGEINAAVGDARASVAATYRFDGDIPSQRALFGFGNEVAVMTIFPFFREAVSSITAKVFGQPILLPVLNRGDVGYDLEDASTDPAFTPAADTMES
ncbi:hypothetical protein [uncultured Microbacterium sp.]|uniref:hypothetical protein n=1 Tax=uncultured Microbacterium sp. TaxID=191216 RepID=UPI0025F0DD0E|nr:hypothetical protein [uncultured Microbacterium sp.]